METISFWSLYDNSKRASLIVKTAQNFLEKNKKIFILDANVFSPELHLDLLGDNYKAVTSSKRTLLDYLSVFQSTGEAPDNLDSYVVKKDNLLFMGPCYSSIVDTASKIQRIDWTYFFPVKKEKIIHGLNLFLNLRNRIKDEYEVDYLLVNTPSGMTGIGTVLNWFVTDKCLCLTSRDKDEKEYFDYSTKRMIELEGKLGQYKFPEWIFD